MRGVGFSFLIRGIREIRGLPEFSGLWRARRPRLEPAGGYLLDAVNGYFQATP
jgi:hypothetical protein